VTITLVADAITIPVPVTAVPDPVAIPVAVAAVADTVAVDIAAASAEVPTAKYGSVPPIRNTIAITVIGPRHYSPARRRFGGTGSGQAAQQCSTKKEGA
jgi:hypothetical protein